jgi:hypothetical protein
MSFSCADKDTLIAYIYDECDAATRESVDSHLAACPACADEVAGFGVVRKSLSQWAAPERVGGFRLVREEDEQAAAPAKVLRPARWWQSTLPVLARVAAAVLVIAGGAALANLEVRYDKDGFVVRTGWQKASPAAVQVAAPSQAAQAPVPQPAAAVSVPGVTPAADRAPSRAEWVAFQRQMRDEVRQQVAATRTAAASPVQVSAGGSFEPSRFMQQVYTLLDESERRQQVDVAYRMSVLARDIQAGRAIDARRIGLDALPPAAPQRQKNGNLFDVSFPVKK